MGFSLGGGVAQDIARRHPDVVRKLMLLGTIYRGGDPRAEATNLEVALNAVPTEQDFLFLFFGRSNAAVKAGREFWERRHQRRDQDPPSSPELMQAQIAMSQAFYMPLGRTRRLAFSGRSPIRR